MNATNNLILAGLFVLAVEPVSAADGAEFRFQTHTIGEFGTKLGQTSLVDIDRDGDLDWVVGMRGGELRWFEFLSSDNWVPHKIGAKALSDVGGTAFDVDGDGWIDQVSGGSWYRNSGDPKKDGFERFENGSVKPHDNVAADIDSDGKKDLISLTDRSGLYWYKIPEDPTKEWIETRIGDAVHGAIDPRGCADLDGDGDVDIVRSTGWFENLQEGASWQWHETIDGGHGEGNLRDTTKSWITDMDGDGDNDVVLTTADSKPGKPWNVRWFENSNGDASEWITHEVAHDLGDLHSLAVFDFNGDGELDIFTGEGPLGGSGRLRSKPWRCFIFSRDESGAWKEHVVAEGYACHEAMSGDVDGDGDIDIAFKPWNGSTHVYLENLQIP